MWFLKYILNFSLLVSLSNLVRSQDFIVKSNGSGIKVIIVEVTDDSIKFRNAYTNDRFIFTVPQSDVKYIEYENGEVQHFVGSYQNLSSQDTIDAISRIEFNDISLVVDSVLITFQNLFSQYNLVFDFSNYSDTTLIVDKGKVMFILENEKKNFTERCYPTDDKIIFSKFVPSYPASNKHFIRLSEIKVDVIKILFNANEIELVLTEDQSELLKEIFLNNQISE